jgi:hypothetical protein
MGLVLFFKEVFFWEEKLCSAFQGMLFVDSKEPSQTLLSNSSPVISPNVVIIQKMLT